MPRPTKRPASSVVLRPADPFELIRWLARSQSDPRKAVAELVQNSLDAGARKIQLVRRRLKGVPTLLITDDGEGVIPEMPRDEALHHLATHIGHSRKLGLTPQERAARVVAGQYGVGLLGFWSIGAKLELRSRVGGGPLMALELAEDNPRGTIVTLPIPIHAPETYTELVVGEVHTTAQRALSGRRLADYLSAELRGQLLSREVVVSIHDGFSRGLQQKDFAVAPRRFLGERLELPSEVAAAGWSPMRLELYLTQGAERPQIQVACAGTRIVDDLAELGALGLNEAPWVGQSLSGLIDFPDLKVPPGTRRGIVPDEAAQAFADAMAQLAPRVATELARLTHEKLRATERDVLKDLRKALRGFDRRLPNYELLPTDSPGTADHVQDASSGLPTLDGEPPPDLGADEGNAPQRSLSLGVLSAVRLSPDGVEVAPGNQRRVLATALDAHGERMGGEVTYIWTLQGEDLALVGGGSRPAIRADPHAAIGAQGRLMVNASMDAITVSAEVGIRVIEPEEPAGSLLGIPEPLFLDASGELWRSRMSGTCWEINGAHEDYLALRGDARARLRYLLALLAKELVQKSYAQPGSETLLDHMVEILAHVERNLRGN